VKSISNAANLWAIEKAISARSASSCKSRTSTPVPTCWRSWRRTSWQLIEGGISAGYFNGIEKNLPITIVMDRVSSPLGHNLMLRPDHKGQITRLAQLKGKTIATNGSGAVSTYEVGKMLETDGLTIADVDIKVMPFTQMAIAMRNKAIDAAIVIPRSPRSSSTRATRWRSRILMTSSSRIR